MSLVSYLTSTVPDGIPLVGSYTLCDSRTCVSLEIQFEFFGKGTCTCTVGI